MFWGLNFGLFVVTAIYMAMNAKKDQENLAVKYGPLAVSMAGALLIMVDLTRHVLLDLELAGEELAMYSDDGEMTGVGLAGVICTWLGVVLMLSGVAWFANLPSRFDATLELAWKGQA